MTARIRKRVVLLSLILSWTGIHAQILRELRTEIDKIIRHDTEISLGHIPGFIIGILDGDSTFILPYGVREPGSGELLSEHDVFELGSITKVMTAQILLTLHESKMLNIYDQLNDFLPAEYRNPAIKSSLLEVLMHQSGISKIPETLGQKQVSVDDPYAHFSSSDLLSWYHALDPGTRGEFRYSHAGFGLLEFVIEQAAGKAYASVFQTLIADDQCLTVNDHLEVCPGFDLAGREVGQWTFPSFISSEGAKGCLKDLLVYVRTIFDDPEDKIMWSTFRPTDEKRLMITPGWYRFLPKAHFPVYVHTGRTSGHSAMIAFSRKTQTAVVILANSSRGTDDLGLLILRMLNKQWRRKK